MLRVCVLLVIIEPAENTFFLLFGRLDRLSVGLLSFSAAVALINIYIYLWFFCLQYAFFFAIIIDIVRV